MGDFQWQDGKGALFNNDKQGNDKRPDVTGEARVHGEMVRLSGWWREGKKGTFLSLNLEDATKTYSPSATKGMDAMMTAPAPQGTGMEHMATGPGSEQQSPPVTLHDGTQIPTEGTVPPLTDPEDPIPF